jgi:radical SAM superfamily enzyme YgiQ (UPF0313 family)
MKRDEREIVFVFPPSPRGQVFKYHLGIGYIQAYLSEHGISSVQYVPKRSLNVETIVKEVLAYSCPIIGFACYDSNYYNIKILARMIKKRKPNALVIAGGPTAVFSDEFVLQDCPEIDICVRGEGEQTVHELLTSSDIYKIRGLAFRDEGHIVRTSSRPLIFGEEEGAELDVIPSPYLGGLVPLDGQCGVTTSRGCVQACTYCNCGVMFGRSVRFHSVERVVAELEKIYEFTKEHTNKNDVCAPINVNDDSFSVSKERTKKICEAIVEKGINLTLNCETRADRCDEELLQLMYQAGFRDINFGLESAVPRILRNVKKISESQCQDLKPEIEFLKRLKHNIQFAKRIGLHVSVSIISGLPGETFDDARETVRFVEKLKLVDYAHNFLTIYKGTELFNTYKNWGLEIKQSSLILPYETLYTYDVSKLPTLPNAMHIPFYRQEERKYLALLCGTFKSPSRNCWTNLLCVDFPRIDNLFCSNLSKLIAMPSCIYDLDENLSGEEAENRYNKLLSHNTSVGSFYYMTRLPLNHGYSYQKLVRLDQYWKPAYSILTVPFSSCEDLKRLRLDKNFRVLYVLKSIADANLFKRFLAERYEYGIDVPQDSITPCHGFIDQCRWSNNSCPATTFPKILMKGSEILPCWNAKPMGRLGDIPEEIRKKTRRFALEEQERRKCVSCEIKNRCSKCLFTAPFSVDEYCYLRRNYLKVDNIF